MKPGDRVADRYVLARELGRGGMGAVYVARDERLGEDVALKLAFAAEAPEIRERFQREARIGARLGKTAGFVRASDVGEAEGGQLYLAMDLVRDARPLDLTSGPLEARLARLRDAAKLVAECHRQGVVHRDLKPANFLQETSGKLWLSDFGLAKVREDAVPELTERPGLTRSGTAAGTPAFMPPEQFDDVKRVDARADVYALGVMLYAALTGGKLPYEGSVTAIAQRHARVGAGLEPPPAPSRIAQVAPDLERLCLASLELERTKRLASADLLVASLDAFLGARPRTPRSAPDDGPDDTLPTVYPEPEEPAPVVRRVSAPPAPPRPTPHASTPRPTPVVRPVAPSRPPEPVAPPPPAKSGACCFVLAALAALALIAGLGILALALLDQQQGKGY